MRFIQRLAPLALLLASGCARPEETCKEPASSLQSPLSTAPRNGAQLGGMTIDAGGVSEGSGAPAAAGDGGYGLLRIYVLLAAPGAGLSGAQSSALAAALDDARGRGVQVFVRAYYQNPLVSKQNAAQTVASIQTDIASLKSVLTASRLEAIPFVQAGFLGPWGEWWDGDLEGADFGTDQQLRTLKTGVVDALKSAFPSTFIQLRYPRDIATYYPNDPQIAFHNDSVLAGNDDGGTFNATKKTALWPDGDVGSQRAWIKERSSRLASVNAGESSEQTHDVSCDELLAYLQEYRIFVFNAQWPAVVTKCSGQLRSSLARSGPLAPADIGGGGSGNGGNGGTGGAPAMGSELGCWAPDQRPWQLCHPEGCEQDRCRRAPSDLECTMYRAAACAGSWPPAGYPGEETLGSGPGGTPSTGGAPPTGGAPAVDGGSTPGSGGSGNGRGGAVSAGAGASGGAASAGAQAGGSPTISPLAPNQGAERSRTDCP